MNKNFSKLRWPSWVFLAVLLSVEGVLVWQAPAEKTLGEGIKIVYVHVSLTWAGMVGFTLAGLQGIWNTFKSNIVLHKWNQVVSWVALGCFVLGYATSLMAAKINWGAVLWTEPRVIASLQFIVVALIILVANHRLKNYRLAGVLSALLAFFLMWSILGTPLFLHPGSPIRESTSLAIQLTFLSMFLLSSSLATWWVWFLHKRMALS